MQVTDVQSVLGGGGGSIKTGLGGKIFSFEEELDGETVGEDVGAATWLEEKVGDGMGACVLELLGEGKGG